ncbi:MAG: ATP-binding protein [Bacteroidota bacterium]|nr:ATP-binding protein [Bacteroidota bacterium]
MSVQTRFSLAIPGKTSRLKEVRRFVARHGRRANLSEEVINAMRTAVDEACANIIEHAYHGVADQIVNIEVTVKPDCFVVSLRDQGAPFDRKAYREPDVRELTRSRASGGLGVRMIHALMDQVEYSSKGRTNEIRLTKFTRHQTDNLGKR